MKNLRVSLTKSKVGLTNTIEYEGKTLSYSLHINRRLKHLYIQIHPTHGVIVKSPTDTLSYIEKFILAKADWIFEKMNAVSLRQSIPTLFSEEGKVLYLGEPILLANTQTPETFYKEKTIPLVMRLVEEWSFQMGVKPKKITFRKAKRRWGSCSHHNDLSFNLTLSQLPLECITYIVIHELAHIEHKHHQARFWECVASYMPEYRSCEKILKHYSPSLS